MYIFKYWILKNENKFEIEKGKLPLTQTILPK